MYSDLSNKLTGALALTQPPVAITFGDDASNAPEPEQAVPAGCSFWEIGAKQTVSTHAAHHQHCSIGVHTHNLQGAAASQGAELETALGAMTGLGYVTGDEVAQIPVMGKNHSNVTYGPLNAAQNQPTLVLVVADAAQSLTLTEAVTRVDGQAPPAMGRPACALVPQVVNSGAAAASLGCCGARAYMDSLKSNIVLWGLPGDRLEQYVSTIETMSSANSILTNFHTKRREAIEGGQTPSVQDSLDALQG